MMDTKNGITLIWRDAVPGRYTIVWITLMQQVLHGASKHTEATVLGLVISIQGRFEFISTLRKRDDIRAEIWFQAMHHHNTLR